MLNMTMDDFKNEILNWLSNHKSTTLPSWLLRNPLVLNWVNSETQPYTAKNIMERVYIVLNGPPPYCEYGNKKQFNTFDLGYRKGCILGNKCQCVSKYRTINQKITIKKKYGVDNINAIPGVDLKRRNTIKKKFGVEYASQADSVKEKLSIARKNKSQEEIQKIIEKTQNTMLDRYGVIHHMKLYAQQEKVKKTNLEKYGTEFPLQNQNIKESFFNTLKNKTPKEKQEIKEKIQYTFQQKYGVNSSSQLNLSQKTLEILSDYDKFRSFIKGKTRIEAIESLKIHPHCLYLYSKKYQAQNLFDKPKKSEFEQQIEQFLIDQNIDYEIGNRQIINPLELDFFIPSLNIAIECCGLYWHSELSANRTALYHQKKYQLSRDKNIKLITIFEDEWKNQRILVENRLMHILKKSKDKVYARKCTIKEIDGRCSSNFISKYHLQGNIPSKINLGLFADDTLVAVMTFDKPRFNKRYQYELIRFCSKDSVVGAAGKLWKYFTRNYDPRSVISYSDNRWGWGDLYEKLGFKFLKSQLGYQYTDYKNRYNRLQFQKHKLVTEGYDSALSEWEIVQLKGYDRIWDCGQSIWSWTNNRDK